MLIHFVPVKFGQCSHCGLARLTCATRGMPGRTRSGCSPRPELQEKKRRSERQLGWIGMGSSWRFSHCSLAEICAPSSTPQFSKPNRAPLGLARAMSPVLDWLLHLQIGILLESNTRFALKWPLLLQANQDRVKPL